MNETIKQEVIIAPGVAESIVALAVAQVEGVAQIGSRTSSSGGGLLSILSKKPSSANVLIFEDEGKIIVDLHVKLFYGYKLQDVAANIRTAVADALFAQAGITIDRVDITIDGIIFKV